MSIRTKDDLFQGYKIQPSEAKKQEFVETALKQNLDLDVKIAALNLMAEIHLAKKWYGLAAKNYCYAGDLANTFNDKMDLYFKGAVLHMRAGDYITADDNFRKVIVLGTSKDKEKLQEKIILVYSEQAQEYENTRQLTKAITIYNRMLMMRIPFEKATQIRLKLMDLYEKIGQPREANRVKSQMQMLEQEKRETEKPKPREYKADDFL